METLANTTSDSGVGGATVGIYRLTPLRRLILGPVRPTPDSIDRRLYRPMTLTMNADSGYRQCPAEGMSAEQIHTIFDRSNGRIHVTD